MRTPLLWTLSLALGFMFYGMVGWMIHMLPYYDSVGVSPGMAAALVAGASGLGIFSRLGFGIVADRVSSLERTAAFLSLILATALLTLLISGGSSAGIAIFLFFFLISSAAGPMLEPLLLTRAFGVAHFATILGMVGAVGTAGMVISPTVAGAIFDRTGSYDWALVMWASAVALSGVFFLLAGRMPRPVIPEPEPLPEPPRAQVATSPSATEAPTAAGGA